ncbi:MAG: CPBP family intramembrane metalloprotease [Rikenellaceae bacterium]|nr:CPBP family intramembrane metalloprotease [Rikenellaceae bacterium]
MSKENKVSGDETAGDYKTKNTALFKGFGVFEILSVIVVLFASDLLVGYVLSYLTDRVVGIWLFAAFTLKFVITISYAVWLHAIRNGSLRGIIRFSWKGFDPVMILWGIILTIAANIVLEPLLVVFPDKYMRMLENAIGSGGWALVTSVIAAPFFEEMLFRGVIQKEISARYGVAKGVIFAALIFGLVHIIPQQVIAAFVIGIVLGYIYVKTKSLISVVLIHGANNAIAQFSLILTDDITVTARELISSDKVYFAIYALSSIFLIIFVAGFIRFCRHTPLIMQNEPEK